MQQMSHSMLALLGLVLLASTGLAVPIARDYMHSRAVAQEVAEMGGTVASRAMRVIRSRAFDQAEVTGQAIGSVTDRTLFAFESAENHFPTGKACSVFGAGNDSCDDVDDFHRMKTATVPFVLGLDSVYFAIDVEVIYVDDAGRRADAPTLHKQVTVRVRDVGSTSRRRPYLSRPVTLARVISYRY